MKHGLDQLGRPDRVANVDGATYLDYRSGLRILVQQGKIRSFTVFSGS